MKKLEFSPWPSYTNEEIAAVTRVLSSNKVNYWTGNESRAFEEEFACFTDCDFAVSLANGSVALEVALRALEIGSGDEVIVTSRTFIASVSAIVNVGAKPIFADCDENSQNVTAATIAPVISNKTKAVLCVHLAGWPCDLDPILELADIRNLFVIEDCAQAHGARYKGKSVGSYGHIGCWSFCQDKIITTGGEGGMVTTNDRNLWAKMWSFKDHGKNWDSVYRSDNSYGYRWVHDSFGTNLRMTEMQAAIGRVQLARLPEWNALRRESMEYLWSVARELPGFRVPFFQCSSCGTQCSSKGSCVHAGYKCYIFVQKDQKFRDLIVRGVQKQGIPCFTGACSEVYLEKAFENSGLRPAERLPVAKRLGETSIMLHCHPTLSRLQIQWIADALTIAAQEAFNDNVR